MAYILNMVTIAALTEVLIGHAKTAVENLLDKFLGVSFPQGGKFRAILVELSA
jgi:hypothetical protein